MAERQQARVGALVDDAGRGFVVGLLLVVGFIALLLAVVSMG